MDQNIQNQSSAPAIMPFKDVPIGKRFVFCDQSPELRATYTRVESDGTFSVEYGCERTIVYQEDGAEKNAYCDADCEALVEIVGD